MPPLFTVNVPEPLTLPPMSRRRELIVVALLIPVTIPVRLTLSKEDWPLTMVARYSAVVRLRRPLASIEPPTLSVMKPNWALPTCAVSWPTMKELMLMVVVPAAPVPPMTSAPAALAVTMRFVLPVPGVAPRLTP